MHISAIPVEARRRDPILSESQPLMGDRIAIGMGIAIKIKPVIRGDMFLMVCR